MEVMHLAREELKRADHLLYVSLKYTRTVDVLKSLIDRLINCLELDLDILLAYSKEKKRLKEVPTNTGLKVEAVRAVFSDETIHGMLVFFASLRKISRAEYKRTNEYRRHVTMIATTDEGIINVDLDLIKEYYERTIGYTDYVENMVFPKKEQ